MHALPLLGLAVMAASGSALDTAWRDSVERLLAAQPAVATSLPAHPLAPSLLAACLASINDPEPVHPALALAVTMGEAPIGLYALDHWIQAAPEPDREAGCRRICAEHPELATAARAMDVLLATAPDPILEVTAWIARSGDTRLGAYARLRRAGQVAETRPWRAVADYLEAWAMGIPPAAQEAAPAARSVLQAQGQHALLALLGAGEEGLLVPPSLLWRRAQDMAAIETDPARQARWQAGQDDSAALGTAERAVVAFLHAKASSEGITDLHAAALVRSKALADFESVRTTLGAEEQAYFLLRLAAHCVRLLETTSARALLEQLPQGSALAPAHAASAKALLLRLDASATNSSGGL